MFSLILRSYALLNAVKSRKVCHLTQIIDNAKRFHSSLKVGGRKLAQLSKFQIIFTSNNKRCNGQECSCTSTMLLFTQQEST